MAMFLKVAFSAAECLPIMAWTCFHNGIGLCPRMLYPKVHCANGINFGYTLRRAIYFCCCCFFFAAGLGFVWGFLVLCFPASLLSPLLCFSAFVLLCLSILLFYIFFSSVMCFCCSTSCSSASLLPIFTASFFFCYFVLFSPFCILNETLKTLGEAQRNSKEILIRTLHETLNEPESNHRLDLKKP